MANPGAPPFPEPHIGRGEPAISAEQEAAIRRQLGFFLGGLTLIPYGAYLLLSALAFARGWLNWETNGGPPALGYFVAMVLDKQIRRYYRDEYGYSLETSPEEDRKARPASTQRMKARLASAVEGALGTLVVVVALGAWLVDAWRHPPVRLLPLCAGVLTCWRGSTWVYRGWRAPGWVHCALGALLIGLGFAPLLLHVPANTPYLGIDGVFELGLAGLATIAISVMEHRLFLQIYRSVVAGG